MRQLKPLYNFKDKSILFKDVAKYINEYKRDIEAVKVLSQIENRFVYQSYFIGNYENIELLSCKSKDF